MGGVREVTPAETSVGDIVLWVVALTTIVGFATTIWTIFSGPSKRNAQTLTAHNDRLVALDSRVNSLEQSQRAMPTKDDMHMISMGLSDMKGEMKAMRAEMEGSKAVMVRLEAIVARHDNHLLKG
jgi:Protein of unknown function (DUF2730)